MTVARCLSKSFRVCQRLNSDHWAEKYCGTSRTIRPDLVRLAQGCKQNYSKRAVWSRAISRLLATRWSIQTSHACLIKLLDLLLYLLQLLLIPLLPSADSPVQATIHEQDNQARREHKCFQNSVTPAPKLCQSCLQAGSLALKYLIVGNSILRAVRRSAVKAKSSATSAGLWTTKWYPPISHSPCTSLRACRSASRAASRL